MSVRVNHDNRERNVKERASYRTNFGEREEAVQRHEHVAALLLLAEIGHLLRGVAVVPQEADQDEHNKLGERATH
jgi:hypothetical protein